MEGTINTFIFTYVLIVCAQDIHHANIQLYNEER